MNNQRQAPKRVESLRNVSSPSLSNQQASQLSPSTSFATNGQVATRYEVQSSHSFRTASFREQKKDYENIKHRFTSQMMHETLESSKGIHSGWLKIRTTLKSWIRVWCQVNPSVLILYKSQEAQKKHRIGIVVLSVCQVMTRPSKKEGFCFKIFSRFKTSIWTESSSALLITLPTTSIILRAPDEDAGKLWLEVLQRGIETSNENTKVIDLNLPSTSTHQDEFYLDRQDKSISYVSRNTETDCYSGDVSEDSSSISGIKQNANNPSNRCEKTRSFSNYIRSKPNAIGKISETYKWNDLKLETVRYIGKSHEDIGKAGVSTGTVEEGNKNFLWLLIKRLRPGMDLSRIPLPVFILEPRSFLEKLSDYHYHCDILSKTNKIDEPVSRLINVVKWYLSGFYKKPNGPKKPYNPLLGEKYRCFWDCPETGSRTFFIAEQVSHHPPVSAFYVTNRKDGYCMSGTLLSKSKYTGNSVAAIFEGKARLHFSNLNENYILSMPFANCRGIFLGTLTLELGGKVEIECVETNCKCELEFKLAPMWASQNSYNLVSGKIYNNSKQTHLIEGYWDKKIDITDLSSNERAVLWEVTNKIIASRLKCYTVAFEHQEDRESVKLWSKVSEALSQYDDEAASNEKLFLEDMQRKEARDRRSAFVPKNFSYDELKKEWIYRWLDTRNWDEDVDILQFEDDFRIKTLVVAAREGDRSKLSSDTNLDVSVSQIDSLSKRFAATRLPPMLSKDNKNIVQKFSDESSDDSLEEEDYSDANNNNDGRQSTNLNGLRNPKIIGTTSKEIVNIDSTNRRRGRLNSDKEQQQQHIGYRYYYVASLMASIILAFVWYNFYSLSSK